MDFSNNSKAIYLQIADDICDKILAGVYKADCRIPSVREYAVDVQVNVNTVMRAYDYLATRLVIYNKRGLGFFTATDGRDKVVELRRDELLGDGLNTIFRQLQLLDVTPENLAKMYNEYLKQ